MYINKGKSGGKNRVGRAGKPRGGFIKNPLWVIGKYFRYAYCIKLLKTLKEIPRDHRYSVQISTQTGLTVFRFTIVKR